LGIDFDSALKKRRARGGAGGFVHLHSGDFALT
jgi:hypothetical protein